MLSRLPTSPPLSESPVYLIAGAYSAHISGDYELERRNRRRLADEYGIRLTFGRPFTPQELLGVPRA